LSFSFAKSKSEVSEGIPTLCANLRTDLNPRSARRNEYGVLSLHLQLCALHRRAPTRFVERLKKVSIEAEDWIV